MIRTTPVPRAPHRAQRPAPLHALVGLPVRAALLPRPQARVLRRAQRRGDLRHLAAVQVPDHRARRRGLPVRRGGARPERPAARTRGVHAVVRRPRLRDGGRRRLPAERQRAADDGRAADAELADLAPVRRAGSRSRTSPTTTRCSPSRARARATCWPGWCPRSTTCPTSGSPRPSSADGPGHRLAHRLHRRPRLRADRPGRRRGGGPRRRPRGRPAPRAAAVRRGGPDDAAHRGRAAAHRRGVARQPHGLDRPRPGHAEGARSGLDAQGRARPQPPLRRQRGDPPRAARRHVAVGDHRDRRRLGRLGPPPPRRGRAAHQGRAGARLGAVAARRSGDSGEQVGYVTSFCYSPVLQRHIGLARVRPELAAPGTELHMETTLHHSTHMVAGEHRPAALLQPSPEDGQA